MKNLKRNYTIEKQKILITIKNCKQFRQYIENAFKWIELMIDYCNFKTLFKNKVLNRKKKIMQKIN